MPRAPGYWRRSFSANCAETSRSRRPGCAPPHLGWLAGVRPRVSHGPMTNFRPIALAGVAASVALAPAAAAQAPQPTLSFDRPCYTAVQTLAFTGSGYTPNGAVGLLFSVPGEARASFDVTADAGGGIVGNPGVKEDDLLAKDEARVDLGVSANDHTRIDAGAPPESQFGAAQLTFTRWAGFSPGQFVPGRKVRV